MIVDTPNVNSSTVRSAPTRTKPGKVTGLNAINASAAQFATRMARPPAVSVNSNPSTTS